MAQLTIVDRFVEDLVAHLGPDVNLLVTADHGMVSVDPPHRVDFDKEPALSSGVVALHRRSPLPVRAHRTRACRGRPEPVAGAARLAGLGGYPRRRRRRRAAGAEPDPGRALRRVGDVVMIAHGATAVVRSEAEPRMSMLAGQHGALTDDELLIPLLQV
ncbi:hypothetical protein GS582_14490 [Rhodococcus hoagii]|nr:hypothetical protein [Prescottella equi]